jgi:hypothetical protein
VGDKKEYIERGALIEHIENMPWKITPAAEISKGIFLQTVEEAPTADVVEVVRCKDCAYREEFLDRVMCRRTAHKSANGWFGLRATADHHYCSYGERKEQT